MASAYPGGLDNFFTAHQDNIDEIIHASTVNDLADAVNKIESALGTNPLGSILYVAPPTGVAATDTAAIQAAHDSLPTAGGIVQLARGHYAINALTFSKPIQLIGHGKVTPPDGSLAAVAAATTLQFDHTTGVAITMTTTSTFLLRDFDLVNTTTPTAGAGILVQGSAGVYARSFQFINISVRGFFTNVHVQDGQGWLMQRCYLGDWVQEGLWIENTILADAGDMGIEGTYFAWGPNNQVAANHGITWKSSGGLRLINSKFNWYSSGHTVPANSIAVQIAPSAGIGTSSIIISGCSIENFAYGIALTASSAATVGEVVISGCELLSDTACVAIVPGLTGVFSEINITGNTFNGKTTGAGIQLENCDNVKYGPNAFTNCTSNVQNLSGITNAAVVPGYAIGASPPSNPTDGDIWVFPADDTNGVYWTFMYDSAETTYKWRFIGGPPLCVQGSPNAVINTLTQIGATGNYYQAATMTATVARSGDYVVTGDVRFASNGGAAGWITAVAFAGTTLALIDYLSPMTITSVTAASAHASGRLTGVAASAVVGVAANGSVPGTYKVANANVYILPIRVI